VNLGVHVGAALAAVQDASADKLKAMNPAYVQALNDFNAKDQIYESAEDAADDAWTVFEPLQTRYNDTRNVPAANPERRRIVEEFTAANDTLLAKRALRDDALAKREAAVDLVNQKQAKWAQETLPGLRQAAAQAFNFTYDPTMVRAAVSEDGSSTKGGWIMKKPATDKAEAQPITSADEFKECLTVAFKKALGADGDEAAINAVVNDPKFMASMLKAHGGKGTPWQQEAGGNHEPSKQVLFPGEYEDQKFFDPNAGPPSTPNAADTELASAKSEVEAANALLAAAHPDLAAANDELATWKAQLASRESALASADADGMAVAKQRVEQAKQNVAVCQGNILVHNKTALAASGNKAIKTQLEAAEAKVAAAKTKVLLTNMVTKLKDTTDDTVTLGVPEHAERALPKHPSLDALKTGDVATNVLAEFAKAKATAETPLDKDKMAYLFQKATAEFAEDANLAELVWPGDQPTESKTPAKFKEAIMTAAKPKIDAKVAKLLPDNPAFTEEKLRVHFETQIAAKIDTMLMKELYPEFDLADTNWGDSEEKYLHVVAPDPMTGEPKMWRKGEMSGEMIPTDASWINGKWAATVRKSA
jgi:hypothetical protein